MTHTHRHTRLQMQTITDQPTHVCVCAHTHAHTSHTGTHTHVQLSCSQKLQDNTRLHMCTHTGTRSPSELRMCTQWCLYTCVVCAGMRLSPSCVPLKRTSGVSTCTSWASSPACLRDPPQCTSTCSKVSQSLVCVLASPRTVMQLLKWQSCFSCSCLIWCILVLEHVRLCGA